MFASHFDFRQDEVLIVGSINPMSMSPPCPTNILASFWHLTFDEPSGCAICAGYSHHVLVEFVQIWPSSFFHIYVSVLIFFSSPRWARQCGLPYFLQCIFCDSLYVASKSALFVAVLLRHLLTVCGLLSVPFVAIWHCDTKGCRLVEVNYYDKVWST
jgi:hypothetical protein